jgi:hypothetical protein
LPAGVDSPSGEHWVRLSHGSVVMDEIQLQSSFSKNIVLKVTMRFILQKFPWTFCLFKKEAFGPLISLVQLQFFGEKEKKFLALKLKGLSLF